MNFLKQENLKQAALKKTNSKKATQQRCFFYGYFLVANFYSYFLIHQLT